MTFCANRLFGLLMASPASRRVALPLASADFEHIHALAVGWRCCAMAFVTRGGFEVCGAVPEIEQLERLFRPANEADGERRVDMTNSAAS